MEKEFSTTEDQLGKQDDSPTIKKAASAPVDLKSSKCIVKEETPNEMYN